MERIMFNISFQKTSVAFLFSLPFFTPAYAVDNCMVGKWRPDPAQLKQQFSQMTKQHVGSIKGNIFLSFNRNGSGTYQMQNFTLSMKPNAGGPPMKITMVMNGNSSFKWLAANRNFLIKNYKMALKTAGSMQMGGTKIPLPSMPINNNEAGKAVANGSYTCSGKKLVFQPRGNESIVKVWYKM